MAKGKNKKNPKNVKAVIGLSVKVINRLLTNEPVPKTSIKLANIKKETNDFGTATFDMPQDGDHDMAITPEFTSDKPVGPDIAEVNDPPKRIFRSFGATIKVTIKDHKLKSTNPAHVLNNGQIIVDLQPVWMKSDNERSRPLDKPVTLIVLHHTGEEQIKSTLNTFLKQKCASAHYVIDTDGEIVKMVRDSRRASHAGCSKWGGVEGVNDFSIGIEIVDKTGNYKAEQYIALLGDANNPGLLHRLLRAHPTIPKTGIVGHSDIATGEKAIDGEQVKDECKSTKGKDVYVTKTECDRDFILTGRKSDPGQYFEWQQLEDKDLGLATYGLPDPQSIPYGGFFSSVADGVICIGNDDHGQKYNIDNAIYDGHDQNHPNIPISGASPPICELQEDLAAIGYSIDDNGAYDEKTKCCVETFQKHFFSGGRIRTISGKLDADTADLIKRVRATVAP